jgi:ABC-type Zn uptake system ZnuABC Zn-binding protein ZnuA
MEVDPEKRAALSKNVHEHLAKIEKLDEKMAAVTNDGNSSTCSSIETIEK